MIAENSLNSRTSSRVCKLNQSDSTARERWTDLDVFVRHPIQYEMSLPRNTRQQTSQPRSSFRNVLKSTPVLRSSTRRLERSLTSVDQLREEFVETGFADETAIGTVEEIGCLVEELTEGSWDAGGVGRGRKSAGGEGEEFRRGRCREECGREAERRELVRVESAKRCCSLVVSTVIHQIHLCSNLRQNSRQIPIRNRRFQSHSAESESASIDT